MGEGQHTIITCLQGNTSHSGHLLPTGNDVQLTPQLLHSNRRQEFQPLDPKHVPPLISAISFRSATLNVMLKSSPECTVLTAACWASNTHGTRVSPGRRAVGAFPGHPVCSLPGSKRSRVIVTPSSSRKIKSQLFQDTESFKYEPKVSKHRKYTHRCLPPTSQAENRKT